MIDPSALLYLSGPQVAHLLDLPACIDAVERAFLLHAEGQALPPRIFGLMAPGGGFHAKGAGLRLDRLYAAVKVNANFPDNPARHGLPTIQGLLLLFDGENGVPLAVMDSAEITAIRTGAATAVAARHLARPDSHVATIVGCGVQGRIQLRALAAVLPLARAFAIDLDRAKAAALARDLAPELHLDIRTGVDVAAALAESDVCVTCTTSRSPVVRRSEVRPGTFLAAVGADNEHKREIDPALLATATVVVDSVEQAAAIGELHWALAEGAAPADRPFAELSEVVAGSRPGRTTASEVTLFDSTGTALQDVAAAVVVLERARAARIGTLLGRS